MFDIILADPPWEYELWSNVGRNRGPKYDVMKWRGIAQFTPPSAPDSVLFVWATWPNLIDSFNLICAWGYTFVDLAFIWVKLSETGASYHFGQGKYTRANSEPCFIAARGDYPIHLEAATPLIVAPVNAEHSRKPDEQYELIDRIAGPGRKLEMFARRPREGWSSWGNEVESDVVIERSET